MASRDVVFSCLFTVFMAFVGFSGANTLYVGGKDGWVLQPCDGLKHWAGQNRFQINDTLVFKYKKGEDSVLVVHKRDYYHCNKTSPIHNLTDGDSILKLTRSGQFFFISGQADNCEKGQKLIVLVMSPNHTTPTTPPTNSTAPSPSPSSAQSPSSPAPDAPGKSAGTVVHLSVGMLWGFAILTF